MNFKLIIFLALIAVSVDGLAIEKPSTDPFQLPNLKSNPIKIVSESGVLARVNPFGKGANLIEHEPAKFKPIAFGTTPKPQILTTKPKTTTTKTYRPITTTTTTTHRPTTTTTTTTKRTTTTRVPTTVKPKLTTTKFILHTTIKPKLITSLKPKPTTTKPYNFNTPSKIINSYKDGHYSAKDAQSKTIKQAHRIRNDGSYKYEYETENGITAHEEGKQKAINGEIGAEAEGVFSYVAPDGQVITMKYIANEAGFQPIGDHIPTPPPMPESVVRLLAFLAKNEKQNL